MGTSFLRDVIFTLTTSLVFASDPSPLEDFCIADKMSNGICMIYIALILKQV